MSQANGQMTSISLNQDQLKKLKLGVLRGRSYWDRISLAFAFRLLDTSDPYFDCFSVLDELDYLEGVKSTSCTKMEEQFKKQPLYPFWHKHYFLAKHLTKNIGIRWNLEDGGNNDLTKMIDEVSDVHGENPEMWPNYLTHRLVVQGFEERAQRGLTGDWIIFAKHEGKNYYLDLAVHQEGKVHNANALLQRIRNGSFAEFPFLFDTVG